jgi:hypothetical protein
MPPDIDHSILKRYSRLPRRDTRKPAAIEDIDLNVEASG